MHPSYTMRRAKESTKHPLVEDVAKEPQKQMSKETQSEIQLHASNSDTIFATNLNDPQKSDRQYYTLVAFLWIVQICCKNRIRIACVQLNFTLGFFGHLLLWLFGDVFY
jgi:hypothetical protein